MFPKSAKRGGDRSLPGRRAIYWLRALMIEKAAWVEETSMQEDQDWNDVSDADWTIDPEGRSWLPGGSVCALVASDKQASLRRSISETDLFVSEEEVNQTFACWKEDTEGGDLYKGSFCLACGTLMLLRDTKMHLKRNRFYGLLEPNQCGKTTLMRANANEQLEGFPKRDELKSVFVEHEIEDEEVGVQDDGFPILSVDKPGWWWVMHTCNEIYI